MSASPPADESATTGFDQPTTQLAFSPGEVIAGKYKLGELMGEGGMGAVYAADQLAPVQRRVALKVIKPGMDTAAVISRFEAERQALAVLDHPNIAKVYDAGATAAGRPFFAMELVTGVPITKFCDQEKLSPNERLELFMPVCQAVQHAHQKGIIHRDLKPSNILIGLYDGKPVPKIIDFGVAKATNQRQVERTMFTEVGIVVGTLEYMAPEQAEPNNPDVDTRADIYSLGVILYELLTGSPPFGRKQLRAQAFTDMLRVIREVEPPRPSTKLSASDELPGIAAVRKTEPKRLTKLIAGDLDWIIMKCLEKERSRRYETANGLAMDLQRHLRDEPVLAGPPSTIYRFRKFLRRNRGPAVAAALLVLALVAGICGTTWGMVQARRATEAERDTRQVAEERLRQIEKGVDLLGALFRHLDPKADEGTGRPLRLQLGERLDEVATRLDADVIADPLATARLRAVLGATQRALGFPDKAEVLFVKVRRTREELLGRDHPETWVAMKDVAGTLHDRGRMQEAVQLLEKTLELQTASLGGQHTDTLITTGNLAHALQDAGQNARAIPLNEFVVEQYRARPEITEEERLIAINNLALAYHHDGKPGRAVPLFEEILVKRRVKPGPNHPHTLGTMSNLALAHQDAGQIDKAVPLLEQVVDTLKAEHGLDYPDTLTAMNNLAMACHAIGKLDRAAPLYEQALNRRISKLGADHPHTLTTQSNLAFVYMDLGQFDKAMPLFERSFEQFRIKQGPDHPDTLTVMNNLALAYLRGGQKERSAAMFEQTLEKRVAKLGATHPHTLVTRLNVASAYRELGQHDRAVPLLELAVEQFIATSGAEHPDTLTAMHNLAWGYREAGRMDKAVAVYEKTLRLRQAKIGPEHPYTLATQQALGDTYLRMARFEDAERALRQVLAIREKTQPDHWQAFQVCSLLGDALLGQKKFADAEPLLKKGYDGLKSREAALPPPDRAKLPAAAERLARLYEAWGKPEEAAKWRKEATPPK